MCTHTVYKIQWICIHAVYSVPTLRMLKFWPFPSENSTGYIDRLHRIHLHWILKNLLVMVRLFVLSRYLLALVIRQKAVLSPANGFKIEEKIDNSCSAPANKNRQKSVACTAAGVHSVHIVYTECTPANNRTNLSNLWELDDVFEGSGSFQYILE